MGDELLQEIQDHIAKAGISASYFGQLACGDSSLVKRLSNGGTVTLRTAERVRSFIAARESPRCEPPPQ